MWYVYLILCKDNSIYTGITNNLEQRFNRHKDGKGGHYTRSHKVVKFLYSEQFETKNEALRREAQVKGLRREKKLNLVRFGQPNPKS